MAPIRGFVDLPPCGFCARGMKPRENARKILPTSHEKTLPQKMLRFLTVGVANTAVDFAVFGLSVSIGAPPLIANVIAWSVAVSFSYLANAHWSFDRKRKHSEALPRFLVMGALISLLVSSMAVGLFSPVIGLWPAKICGTVVAAVLNFVAARWSIENRLGR